MWYNYVSLFDFLAFLLNKYLCLIFQPNYYITYKQIILEKVFNIL